MFRPALLASAVAALLVAPAAADPLAPTHDAAGAMGAAFVMALDADRSGTVEPEELSRFADAAFSAIDADSSGDVTRAEMLGWADGPRAEAAFVGRAQGYDAALGTVFDLFDRDRDGRLTPTEHAHGIVAAAAFADLDGDGVLTTREFRDGYVLEVAMRNAFHG